MRKLNYTDPKLIELTQSLSDIGYTYSTMKESIEVTLVDARVDKKKLIHLLSTINGVHKVPPLSQQVIEGEMVMSIYDLRM
jgi:hypothetical protein